ncbi:hypothetical protein ACC691_39770, partial [Rhizobium johnstonii]|uniref:hypothetical protein n=1 Tax=Rhizobium johnstonii TaxID=3019933 RepID=UPI003F95080A
GFDRESAAGGTDKVTLTQAEAELGQTLGMSGDAIHKIITDALAADPKSDFAYVAKSVDADTLDKVNSLSIPWVVPWRKAARTYPD